MMILYTPSFLLYGLAALAASASLARASLSNMRATIPGSIHQCSTSNVFFFDTDDPGLSKVLLFVSPNDAASLGPGQLSLSSVLNSITPLQKIENINSKDAAEFDFTVELKEDTEFSTLGFLSDGSGKNLGLDRKVMQPLPDAPNCLAAGAGAASVASQSVQPEPTTSSSSTPAPPPAPTTTETATAKSSFTTSQQEYASRFVTSTRPKATAASSSSSSAASVATSLAALSASLSLPPSSASSVNANATATATATNGTVPASAAAATSPVVVKAKYLLTSFIEISDDKSTDGTVSSSVIKGGYITSSGPNGGGGVNGTILPIGTVLYAPNSTASIGVNSTSTSTAAKNGTVQTTPSMLLSASYTFTMQGEDEEEDETVFVMAQTPLAQNFTTEALLMTFQSSNPNSTVFSNITILGKAQTINTTMFRIDSYYLEDEDSEDSL